jgi:hypothetical protein
MSCHNMLENEHTFQVSLCVAAARVSLLRPYRVYLPSQDTVRVSAGRGVTYRQLEHGSAFGRFWGGCVFFILASSDAMLFTIHYQLGAFTGGKVARAVRRLG